MLSALETVNLIRDAGFEKDSEVWGKVYDASGEYDSTIINRHDPDSAYMGDYCGSVDTRTRPAPDLPNLYRVRGALYQIPLYDKTLEDFDSLKIFHMASFRSPGIKSTVTGYAVSLKFFNSSDLMHLTVWYTWLAPDLSPAGDDIYEKFFHDTIGSEVVWYKIERDLKADIHDIKGLPLHIELDTFLLTGFAINSEGYWRGQKSFFDGIRLTGYADYDVGVKEILSPDSIRDSGDSLYRSSPDPMYQPVARIKNFGREPADTFLAIAEILNEYGLIYADTVPWSMDGDTEDTITFRQCMFEFPMSPAYTLIVRTAADPDECDEDDEVSKTLYYSAVAEKPVVRDFNLEVLGSFTDAVLRVTYSLPYDEQGTLSLYDATGRRIEQMTVRGSGKGDFKSELPSGIYIVRLETEQRSISRKAVVLN
jgi:hypothetical protein